jgi:hypothetical protein
MSTKIELRIQLTSEKHITHRPAEKLKREPIRESFLKPSPIKNAITTSAELSLCSKAFLLASHRRDSVVHKKPR